MGSPISEASYVGVQPSATDGDYELTLRDVPADAFWSIPVYNAKGHFEQNIYDKYTVNSVTAQPNPDCSVTVHFVTGQPTAPNSIPVPARN